MFKLAVMQSCQKFKMCYIIADVVFTEPPLQHLPGYVTVLVTSGNSLLCREQRQTWRMGPANDPPLVCSHKTHRPCWFTDKNKVPFCVSQCWCETLLKQDISLFSGAHLSKVMAWKIWVPLKGNRDYKAIIHFLSYWHCHHSLDRLT